MKSYIGSLLIGMCLALFFSISISFGRIVLDDEERITSIISDFIIVFILLSLFITGMFLIG